MDHRTITVGRSRDKSNARCEIDCVSGFRKKSLGGLKVCEIKHQSRCESERSEAMQAERMRIRGQFIGLRVRDQRTKKRSVWIRKQ